MKKSTYGFTLIEIVVSATILVILTSIGFYSYTKSISDARDSTRITNISALESQLSLYKRERGAYPFPGDYFNIANRGNAVAHQGKMNKSVSLSTATNLPLDPELDIPYLYATTKNRQEYQLAASVENSDSPYTYLVGDYKSISNQVLPNIILAAESENDLEINVNRAPNDTAAVGEANRDLFLFHKGYQTLPYDFVSGAPYHESTSTFDDLWDDAQSDYWQNTDYRSCEEINTAGKNITATGSQDSYQILSPAGVLTDEPCDGIL